MRIVISGYYGFGNTGDEAVLAAMLAALRARLPASRITVLSADPAGTRRLHSVHSVPRLGAGVVRALAGADLFLSGGGSLFQDETSHRSALYYLGILALAEIVSRRAMVFAQGIGPLRRGWIRRLAALVLNRAHLITVRDEDSLRTLRELGVRRPAHVVADPAFALQPAPEDHVRELIGAGGAGPRIGVALRPWRGDAYVPALVEALQGVRQAAGAGVVVFAFHPERDLPLARAVAEALGARLVAALPPREMVAAVGMMDVMVGVRLHALIAAVATGVPPVGLSYDPKIDALFRRIGVGHLLPLAGLQAGQLQQAVLAAWQSRDELRPQLLRLHAALREEALRAADLAEALLSTPPR
ncbi:MAG TPA: polysaccharide pyruvyl transferase CsaB [bacterium]|nr:polysaccharide pyruvyl transferase CsaB [bacterium]